MTHTQQQNGWDARLRLVGAYDSGHGMRLSGDIFDDLLTTGSHPFPDGTRVSTSPVTLMDGRIWTTRSGTRYRIEFADEQPAQPPLGEDE